jgi:TonB family protein
MMSISFISEFFSAPHRAKARPVLAFFFFSVLSAAIANAGPHKPEPWHATRPGEPLPRTATDRTGALETRDGLTLKLTADLGSVRIIPLEAGAAPVVRYSVHIETDAKAAIAQHLLDSYVLKAKNTSSGVEINGLLPSQATHGLAAGAQFWIQFEVAIPPGYSVDVKTEAGDIETQNVGGTASLVTQGGNIRTGRIGVNLRRNFVHPVARLDTQGGHIQAQDVAGDLIAFTAGGHINVGNVAGDASLKSGGGHVRAGRIGGRADLETDGGNITVGQAASFVSVRTGGGQIDFGEVHGSVHAETGGGGIRIMYVAGPMEVESSGGSICLTRVAGKVQAATGDGTITAWINPDMPSSGNTVQLAGASQLSSRNGDIIVFLPRNLAANIEATVANGDERRIEADPALHLAFQTVPMNGQNQMRATTVLNGGGAPLKLRTAGGKIRLQFLENEMALRQSLMRDQMERLKRSGIEQVIFSPPLQGEQNVQTPPPGQSEDLRVDWLERWIDELEVKLAGGLREDPEEFQKRLTYHPKPAYPALAQRVGVQGYVKLQVRIMKDGHVEVMKLLEGDPELANAAMSAVSQWRGQPVWINGQPLEVISLVIFNFQLH